MPRVLAAAAAVLLLAGCRSTQQVVCPTDSTQALDATVTQLAPAIAPYVSTRIASDLQAANDPLADRSVGAAQVTAARVRFSVVLQNRSDEEMRVRQIALDTPATLPSGDYVVSRCFGAAFNATLERSVRGFDVVIPPHGSRAFEIQATEVVGRPGVSEPTVAARVVTLGVRVERKSGTRSEQLIRKINFHREQKS
jgi:outer membrane murein-binding lipoprotein Lpp